MPPPQIYQTSASWVHFKVGSLHFTVAWFFFCYTSASKIHYGGEIQFSLLNKLWPSFMRRMHYGFQYYLPIKGLVYAAGL